VQLPALPFGCSTEHHAFPGTVSLQAGTLTAVLCDAVRSLAAQGFAAAFIFSAHGGNYAPLAAALPAIRAAAAPLQVIAFTDLDAVVATWARAAAAVGVAPNVAGHHAGEFETSIVLALDAAAVRRHHFAAGLLDVGADAQSIFYPDLRRHAPSGVVGDPRPARATRATAYLDAWVDLLVEHYRREKNAKYATGTHPE
jgi:creatinine amidohydrolase/Fe(II)-dependent formamide hydrolase-like protein